MEAEVERVAERDEEQHRAADRWHAKIREDVDGTMARLARLERAADAAIQVIQAPGQVRMREQRGR